MDTKIQPVTPPRKRGPYRQHSTEFKRAVVAKSFVEGTSVARLAREFSINANQVFTWRRQFADLQDTVNEGPAAALLPVTVQDLPAAADERVWRTPGVIVLTVGVAQLRLDGSVDAATLEQVLARLLPRGRGQVRRSDICELCRAPMVGSVRARHGVRYGNRTRLRVRSGDIAIRNVRWPAMPTTPIRSRTQQCTRPTGTVPCRAHGGRAGARVHDVASAGTGPHPPSDICD